MAKKFSRSSSPRAAATRPVHYVLSTHWDREWYQTFQSYRQRLVTLLDRVLDDLAAGKLRGPFTTDGQAVVLDDYLEIRPERRAQVEQFARDGRLKIGPWFVLPDEWLVSGEAIIRNLHLGRATARRYGGEPSDAGFVCDLFGHIGQMPQLLAGFGIKGAFLWRGIGVVRAGLLWWQGSDGTRLLCYRFPRAGYCDYAYDVRRSIQYEMPFEAQRARRDLDTYLAKEARRLGAAPLLVFDGGDHLEYESEHYRELFARAAGAEFPYAIQHSTLDAYLAAAAAHAANVSDVLVGELRAPGRRPAVEEQDWLIPGVLSSRVWIKQANARCQTLLCHWAEPLAAAATAFCGAAPQAGYLNVAWRWLLLNHPHDSICGCSIDEVHEDMKYRFAQCEQIADNVASTALRTIAAAVAVPVGERELRVVIANALPQLRREVVELTLQLPAEWRCFQEFFGFEPKPGFRIYGPDGAEIPYQRLAQAMNHSRARIRRTKFPQAYRTNDVTIALPLSLPALGYTTLIVREGELAASDEVVPPAMLPTRHRDTPGLATSERSIENEHLAVLFGPNGTLTLTDKRTGESYLRLLTFEDVADIGDGWFHGPPVNDAACFSTGAQAEIALLHDGPALTRFRVRQTLRLPEEFSFDRMVRSERTADLRIESLVTLRAGSDRLEVQTNVDNNVRDHRLRVLLPAGVKADTYFADGAFDVVERPIALPADHHLGRELAVETRPQQSWTAVAGGRRGLAIIAPGLPETTVRDVPDRTLALTLFRATRRTVGTDGQPLGQLQGTLSFRYDIAPLAGTIDSASLCHAGIALAAGVRTAQLAASDLLDFDPTPPLAAALPARASALTVSGHVVVTSVRDHEGALEVRLFNPAAKTVTATIDFRGRPPGVAVPQRAQPVNFESVPQGRALAIRRGIVRVPVRAKQILTLRCS